MQHKSHVVVMIRPGHTATLHLLEISKHHFRFIKVYFLFISTLYLLMPIFGASKPMPDAAFDYSGHSLSSVGFGCSLGFAAYLIRAFPFLLGVFFDSRKKAYGCYVSGLISPQPLEKRIDISSGR